MINSVEELKDYFWFCGGFKGRTHSVNVSTKIRKQLMTCETQGKVTVNNGRVEVVKWKNLGGGIWEASVYVPDI